MFSEGIFAVKDKVYTVFLLEEGKYNRIDICEKGATFNIDVSKVKYSSYTKNNTTYVYGDKELYDSYRELKRKCNDSLGDISIESGWVDIDDTSTGVIKKVRRFQKVQTKQCKDCALITTKITGKIVNQKYLSEDYKLDISRKDLIVSMLEPMNKSSYKKVANSKETKDISGGGFRTLEMIRNSGMIDLSHLDSKDMGCITDVEEGRAYLERIRARHKSNLEILANGGDILDITPIVVDFETSGTDFDLYGKDVVTDLVISVDEDEARLFSFNHNDYEGLPWSFFDELARVLIECEESLLAHNKKFEQKVFYSLGYIIHIKHDSMFPSILLDPRMKRNIHGLKYLESKYLGHENLELYPHIFYSKKDIDFRKIPKDLAIVYACPDGFDCRHVWRALMREMPKVQRFLYDIECRLANVKAEQEYWGLRIDKEKFEKSASDCRWLRDSLKKRIYSLVGRDGWKLNSSEVLSDILYNQMGCPILARSKTTKKPSTGMSPLTKLSKMFKKEGEPLGTLTHNIVDKNGEVVISKDEFNKAKYPLTLLLIKYRKVEKLISSFYDRIEKQSQFYYDEVLGDISKCMRWFFSINQNGAESGRQSTTAHQNPKAIKGCILSDSVEHDFINADYSQIELRVMPSLAKETPLVELCKERCNDIHRAINALINKVEMWAISSEDRQAGKSRNFGVVYLISGIGLAVQKFGAGPTKAQIAECNESIAEFFDHFKRISKYLKQNEVDVVRDKVMWTLFYRARYFPDIDNKEISSSKRKEMIRQANNLPVQGTAADIMKIAEVQIYDWIERKGWNKLVDTPQGKYPLVRLALSAHDEVLVFKHQSVPMEEVLEMLRDCMEIKIKDFAPLFANPAIVDNWVEGKSSAFEIDGDLRDKQIEEYYKTGKSAYSNDATKNKKISLEYIKEYHEKEIKEYMEGLIKEYGEDIDELANHVRHPSLTHDLIDRYSSSKEDEKIMKHLSHLERIHRAVEQYMLERQGNRVVAEVEEDTQEEKLSEADIDRLTMESIEEITKMAVPIIEMDETGALIEDEETDSVDEDYMMFDDDYGTIDYISKKETPVIYRLFDDIVVDPIGVDDDDKDELAAIMYKYVKPDGFFKLLIVVNDPKDGEKIVDTGLLVEDPEMPEVENFIRQKSNYLRKEKEAIEKLGGN